MPRSQYRTAKIPEELAKLVDKVLEEKTLGYRSFNEFVVDAVRRRLEELGVLKYSRKQS